MSRGALEGGGRESPAERPSLYPVGGPLQAGVLTSGGCSGEGPGLLAAFV